MHFCRLHNICIPIDSFAEDSGRGVKNRGDTATQFALAKKKSNLQFALEVSLTDQAQTSIR